MPTTYAARHASSQQRGFTAVELMVVIAIIAIIAAIGIPNFGSMMTSSRTTSASNNLLGAMQIARSEAITRRTAVTVCASSDQSSCSGSWADGGVVRTDTGTVIRTIPAAENVAVAGAAISFRSDGTTVGGTITVGTRSVTVNAIGRAKIQ